MNNYMHRLLLTLWRRKSSVLAVSLILTTLILGLQYSYRVHRQPRDVLDPTRTSSNGASSEVKREAPESAYLRSKDRFKEHPEPSEHDRESERQLGIPFVNLDPHHPYIPKARLIHFDLKGAPPKMNYLKKVLNLVRNLGATGILLEYEDMFPFQGPLKPIAAKNAYTRAEIKDLLEHAETLKLEIIPLVQTFGHVEFALKHKEFANIREVPGSPQSLCPSRNTSMEFIAEMINQVLELHPTTKYLHIGCDEVYQMGECELCRLELHDTLFLRHIQNVVNMVHDRHPGMRLIIWDDMLRHLSTQSMLDVQLGQLVEPMIWVYAEDIYRFVQPQVWEKYAAVFPTAWTASAFKGAFGETLYVPDARRHLENNLRWLDVMSQQSRYFSKGFRGIVLTGWQRYDHFAVLCELLPASLPSMALSLIAVSNGYFNASHKPVLMSALSCPQYGRNTPFINLDMDPHLWDKLGRCMFPGSPFFRLTYRLYSTENEINDYIKVTTKSKGWMTEYNVRRNYSLPLRVEELTADLPRMHHGALSIARSAFDAMQNVYDNYTVLEWIEQRVYPLILQLETIQNQSVALKSVQHWPARPLKPLKDLERLGIT